MKKIKNPNDIVDSFVSDYRKIFGEQLVSVIMYGSAVTHEYKPGESDINIVVILSDNSIEQIVKSHTIQRKWNKRNVSTPFFLTKEYIQASADTYPIEYLDMRSNYRVLFGEDVLAKLELVTEHIRLQCERELRGAAIHLRRSFVSSSGNVKELTALLNLSMRRLMPVFKGLIALRSRPIPKSKSDIVAMVEDSYNLGASSLSEIFNARSKNPKSDLNKLFNTYTYDIEKLINTVDSL